MRIELTASDLVGLPVEKTGLEAVQAFKSAVANDPYLKRQPCPLREELSDIFAVYIRQNIDYDGCYPPEMSNGEYAVGVSYNGGNNVAYIQTGFDFARAHRIAFGITALNKTLQKISTEPYVALNPEKVDTVISGRTMVTVLFKNNKGFGLPFMDVEGAQFAAHRMRQAIAPPEEKPRSNVVQLNFSPKTI